MKLKEKYLLLKGGDYSYTIYFDKIRFSGFSLLDIVFENGEPDSSTQQMVIFHNNVKFKAIELENGFRFEFGEEVENSKAYDIMLELSDKLKMRWIKTALYFIEKDGNIAHLIY